MERLKGSRTPCTVALHQPSVNRGLGWELGWGEGGWVRQCDTCRSHGEYVRLSPDVIKTKQPDLNLISQHSHRFVDL